MTTPIVGREIIPEHLPKRLTIAFWFGYWVTDTAPGEGFADLEQVVQDLVARGFNTIRIDGLWSWIFEPDGSRRGPIEIGPVIEPGYGLNCPGVGARGGQRVDVLAQLLKLLELCRKYDVYVGLTSWEYQPGHTLGFIADPGVRQEILSFPVADRFPYTATQIDRELQEIKRAGFADRLAYVEVHNEIDYSIGLGLTGGAPALKTAVEGMIGFLRERHPDLLICDDYSLPASDLGFEADIAEAFCDRMADNSQVVDHHLYAWGAGVQVGLFRELGFGIGGENHDETMRRAEDNPFFHWLLRPDREPWERFKQRFGCDWFSQWQPLLYVYHYLDVDRWDVWMFTHYPQYEERMRGFWRNGIQAMASHARKRHLPLVCDEGYICWPPNNSAFEPSAVGRANLDYVMDRMLEAGYWGYMISTYAFPTQPLWDKEAAWLKRTHERILGAT